MELRNLNDVIVCRDCKFKADSGVEIVIVGRGNPDFYGCPHVTRDELRKGKW